MQRQPHKDVTVQRRIHMMCAQAAALIMDWPCWPPSLPRLPAPPACSRQSLHQSGWWCSPPPPRAGTASLWWAVHRDSRWSQLDEKVEMLMLRYAPESKDLLIKPKLARSSEYKYYILTELHVESTCTPHCLLHDAAEVPTFYFTTLVLLKKQLQLLFHVCNYSERPHSDSVGT